MKSALFIFQVFRSSKPVKTLQNKITFHRFFHRFWPCEKCPVHRFLRFQTLWKSSPNTILFHRFFHRFFHRLYFTGFFIGFFTGFDPVKSALFTGFQNFTPCEKPVKKHVKTCSSQVLSQDNSQVFHRFSSNSDCQVKVNKVCVQALSGLSRQSLSRFQ